ncbi:MAG: aspartate-semialdehyde dehydrogenase [Candidatus Wallbacteria bacterium]|nr:aspartate-semialdehyde dehydrogenase [Candidatus Wallbacteria bacterium]
MRPVLPNRRAPRRNPNRARPPSCWPHPNAAPPAAPRGAEPQVAQRPKEPAVKKSYRVGIVGATGAVGTRMREVLEERRFPVASLSLYATGKSAGKKLPWKGEELTVQEAAESAFGALDFVLFSAGAEISRQLSPHAAKAGAVVIDNSNGFRMEPGVPLVVPEVNGRRAFEHRGIIANPNCSTIQLVVALWPLHCRARIRRIVVSTYQSVSGTGLDAMDEMQAQSRARLAGGPEPVPRVYPHPIAFNCLPQVDLFDAAGNSLEEMKMINETRKIFEEPVLSVTATCVRVPVLISHSEAVNVEFEEPLSPDEARTILAAAPGVVVQDDPAAGVYPLARTAEGTDDVFVGRIRRDTSCERALNLWIVSDNLRKGAATNAIQIAETLIENAK